LPIVLTTIGVVSVWKFATDDFRYPVAPSSEARAAARSPSSSRESVMQRFHIFRTAIGPSLEAPFQIRDRKAVANSSARFEGATSFGMQALLYFSRSSLDEI
jgi:hypothetical protein